MKKKNFIDAVSELGSEKGLSKEQISNLISDTFVFVINKKLEDELRVGNKLTKFKKTKGQNEDEKLKGNEKLPDALIKVDLDLDKGNIKISRGFKVLNDDDITDDFLEISIEEAKKINSKIKLNDILYEEISFDTLELKDVDRFVSNFRQRITAVEKDNLLSIYKDKIGNIITGVVEKGDENFLIVNLGKATTRMSKKELIGNERYTTGDTIKVYLEGIKKDDRNSLVISCTRRSPEFLRKLFESEVTEIADGIVIIKDIARNAGIRSKVVVESLDENVDPSGACIGKNGERVQRIVSQLGNAKDSKEKIDVILYHKNLGVYLAEILKPAEILGINFYVDNLGNNCADVVTKLGSKTFAIGNKGVNISLAKKLTKLDEIKIYDESELEEHNITSYKTLEEYEKEDFESIKEEERRKFREENIKLSEIKKSINEESEVLKKVDEILESDESIVSTIENKSIKEEVDKEPITQTIETKPVIEKEVKEEIEVKEEPKKEESVKKFTKVTTTLESLEKSLEEEKRQKKEAQNKKSGKKKENKNNKKSLEEDKKSYAKMDIYTKEEREAFENEDLDNYDDDYFDDEEDYSSYDDDSFYEEK